MPIYPFGGGHLEVIVGPMFSGKSEELIRRIKRAVLAKQKVQVFKPVIDRRYDAVRVASHDGRTLEAVAVENVESMHRLLEDDTQVVAIDEAQFFDEQLVPFALDLADAGKRVLIAGLDL